MEAETKRRMGTPMTDKERQRLCADLRRCKSSWLEDAADELERLAKENHILKLGMEAWPEILKDRDDRLAALAQSDAEPVAWQYRIKQGGWGGWHEAQPSREEAEHCVSIGRKLSGGHIDDYEIRPLYAAPPRPDASAGLIEALQQIIDNCDDNSAPQCRHDLALKFVREIALKAMRSRADRGGSTDYIPIGGAGNGA